MKKLSYLWMLLLALMVGVSFVSCDDDDEGDVGAPKELLGTWLWYGDEITFNANGSGVIVEEGERYPFSFTYDAASKTVTVSADGEVMRWTIVSISDTKMVAVNEDGYEEVFLRPGTSGGEGEGGGDIPQSAPEYDTSAPVDLPDAARYADVSGKYEINTSEIPYRSIELTADGQYVAIKAAAYPYGVKATARKATKVAGLFNRRPVFSRNIENTMLIAGRFEQVIENEYSLEGLGTLVVEGRDGNGNITAFKMIGYDGVETEVPVQKAVNVDDELTGNSGNLCRMWTAVEERAQYYMEKVNVYDAIYRVDADQVTTYVNSYGIDWAEEDIFDVGSEAMERVLFSQAGTYLQFFRDGSVELSYWRWEDKANGVIYAYDFGEEYDGATATAVFYGNRVNVLESFSDYSEEDDLLMRSIYTTVLEAAY